MKIDFEKARVFVRPGVTDMRKHINGLAAIVEGLMQESEPPRVYRRTFYLSPTPTIGRAAAS